MYKKKQYKTKKRKKMIGGVLFPTKETARTHINTICDEDRNCVARVYVFEGDTVKTCQEALVQINQKNESRDIMFLADKNWKKLMSQTGIEDLISLIGYDPNDFKLADGGVSATVFMLVISRKMIPDSEIMEATYEKILDILDKKYDISNNLQISKHNTPVPLLPLRFNWKEWLKTDNPMTLPSSSSTPKSVLKNITDPIGFKNKLDTLNTSHVQGFLMDFFRYKSGVNRFFSNTGRLLTADKADTGMIEKIIESSGIPDIKSNSDVVLFRLF